MKKITQNPSKPSSSLSLEIFQLLSESQMPENEPKIFWLKIKIFLLDFSFSSNSCVEYSAFGFEMKNGLFFFFFWGGKEGTFRQKNWSVEIF